MINARPFRMYWDITRHVGNGLPTITQQLTDSSAKEFIYNGILSERNYTVEVRGYIYKLGPTDTTIVNLDGKYLCNLLFFDNII